MKTIPGYPKYQISENGEIYSFFRKRFLEPLKYGKYQRIHLKNDEGVKTKFIHYLVALTYIPNPKNLPFVNHIDGTGEVLNNNVKNLEWVTCKENIRHAIQTNLIKKYKIPVVQMDLKCNEIARFDSIDEAGKATNTRPQSISSVCNRKAKKAGGYYWKRLTDENWTPLVKKVKFKKIEKVNEEGFVQETFRNMDFLCKSQKCAWKSINKAIKNKSLFRGFYWRYAEEKEIIDPLNKKMLNQINSEEWKFIDNFENYKISRGGEVFNTTTKNLLKLKINQCGEAHVRLINKGNSEIFTIKKLVATSYIPNPENKKNIRHINGDKSDNRVENLEWFSVEKKPQQKIEPVYKTDGEIVQYTKKGYVVATYDSIDQIKEKTNFNTSLILDICNKKGRFKTERDYVWRFKGNDFEEVSNKNVLVLQLDINTGEIINRFDTIKEAKDFLEIGANSHIGDVCRGKRNVAHGYKWEFEYK